MAANSRISQHPDPTLSSSPLAQLVVRLVQSIVELLPERWLLHWSFYSSPMVVDNWVEKAAIGDLGWLWLQHYS